jgi:hypothetical protein
VRLHFVGFLIKHLEHYQVQPTVRFITSFN